MNWLQGIAAVSGAASWVSTATAGAVDVPHPVVTPLSIRDKHLALDRNHHIKHCIEIVTAPAEPVHQLARDSLPARRIN